MKHVCVTYHMTRRIEGGRETVESCITLPMSDDSAKDLIEKGEESPTYIALVNDILDNLSGLLGLDYVGFCSAKLADEDEADDEPKDRYRVTWCDFKGQTHEIKCRTLQDAITEKGYLDSRLVQGPVQVEAIKR